MVWCFGDVGSAGWALWSRESWRSEEDAKLEGDNAIYTKRSRLLIKVNIQTILDSPWSEVGCE
jgi:hypothetical protein